MRNRSQAALAAPGLLGLCAIACSALFDYPSPEGESSASLCHDGVDNDYDGVIDCDDSGCDGFCPELDATTCADGRDNDGDGLVDGSDPRCWVQSAPAVTRCASRDPSLLWERFDASLSSGRWFAFGSGLQSAPVVENQAPVGREAHPDRVLGFASTQAPVRGGIASTVALDGDWSGFDLTFTTRLVAGGFAQVALVPASLVADDAPPVDGWESASVLVELEGRAEPRLTLRTGERQVSIPIDAAGDWHTVRLSVAGEELVMALDDGLDARLPRPALPSSKLLVFGETFSTQPELGPVQLDDLRVSVPGSLPCSVASPQIPFGATCRTLASKRAMDAGYTTAAAGGAGDALCAMVTAGDTGDEHPSRVQTWESVDGDTWSLAGELSTGRPLTGAGLAWDSSRGAFRSVVGEIESGVRLLASTSTDCAAWTEPKEIAKLPADAEAPSYVILADGAHAVYYTRPAASDAGRSLWRLLSNDGAAFESEATKVAEFGREDYVSAPVSITRVGQRDLVATYPISPNAGQGGLGVLVSMDTDATWAPIALWPVFGPAGVRGGFDADAIVSGSLVAAPGGVVLLYGARGQPLPAHVSPATQLTVGTARLTTDGALPTGSSAQLTEACGDATCQSDESCDRCPIDCGICEGHLLAADRFSSGADWQLVSPVDGAAGSDYVAMSGERVLLEPGRAAWLVRTLPADAVGDFELIFDVHVVAAAPSPDPPRCTAYVGVGRRPSPWTMNPEGVFLQVDQVLPCSEGAPAFSPRVRTGRTRSESSLDLDGGLGCTGAIAGLAEAWHRVALRRESGLVSVRVFDRDGCEREADGVAAIAYVGALDGLDALMLGWGGHFAEEGWQAPCENGTAAVTIDNLVLRNLPCPADGIACGSGGPCVNVAQNPEHCGACGSPVGAAEVCEQSHPACRGTLCADPQSGTDVCVNLEEDASHCGACGVELGPLEWCVKGLRQASMVPIPAGFWIDSTEVTRAQYAAWLATEPKLDTLPERCASWKGSFVPRCGWPPEEHQNYPVRCVDWCDANAYCAAIDKHLCGAVGGGSLTSGPGNPETSQWVNACSAGGLHTYQYGDELDETACHLPSPEELHEVGELPGCQSVEGDYAGVYDMQGNVSEWSVLCYPYSDDGIKDTCATFSARVDATCKSTNLTGRSKSHYTMGIRCCAL